MKNTFYAIEIVETGTWVVDDGLEGWCDSGTSSEKLEKAAVYFRDDEELTDSLKQAREWAKDATASLHTKCRVVALVVTRKGGVR